MTEHIAPYAFDFDDSSWRERSVWRNSRIRALERIEQDLRPRLEAFCEKQRPLADVMRDLDRMERWIKQVRSECEAIELLRERRQPPALLPREDV